MDTNITPSFAQERIDLSIIIVNWNVASLLENCIRSILSGPVTVVSPGERKDITLTRPTVEIIVVDSCSSDDSVLMLQEFPKVITIPLGENVGFSKGCNIGFSLSRGRYILLLNPDTEIIDKALRQLIEYMDDNSHVGFVGPHTFNSDGTTQPTRRNFPNFMTLVFSLNKNSGKLRERAPDYVANYYYMGGTCDREIMEVDWVQGSALLIRRETYESVGGLDEDFWMYLEEIDWCRRARTIGWLGIYMGEASIVHHQGKSTLQVPQNSRDHYERGLLLYFQKHHGQLAGWCVKLLLWFHHDFPLIIGCIQLLFWLFPYDRWNKIWCWFARKLSLYSASQSANRLN